MNFRRSENTNLHLVHFTYLIATFAVVAGCLDSGDGEPPTNDQEVITTVELTFTPNGSGNGLVFVFADPENDGEPVVDDIVLSNDVEYTLSLRFLDELDEPAVEITDEISEEGEEHQIFFLDSAVEGPATGDNIEHVLTHAYDDEDTNGLPLGLRNAVVTDVVGAGNLRVVLRHLPPENDVPTKTEGLAETLADSNVGALPGESDVDVTFSVEVQ